VEVRSGGDGLSLSLWLKFLGAEGKLWSWVARVMFGCWRGDDALA